MTTKYVPGYGNPNAKILILGEAPGENEEKIGRPFVGASGQLLDELLREVEIDRSQCYLTNVFKYRPPGNDLSKLKKLGIDVREGYPELYNEIRTINPNVILGLGNLSLEALTGLKKILNYRGSVLPTVVPPYKAVFTVHPSALFERGTGSLPYYMRRIVHLDLLKLKRESAFKDHRPVKRTHEICKSAAQLARFLDSNKTRLHVAIDIESIKCIPSCIGLAFSPSHGMSIPLLPTRDIIESYHEIVEIYRILDKFFRTPGLKIIGQNFKYDQEKLERPSGFTVPDPYIDTMLLAHTLHPELKSGLGFLTSIYTDEPYYKDEYKEFNPAKDKLDQVFIYNSKDATVTFEVAQKLVVHAKEDGVDEFYFGYVNKLHRLYRDIESEGFLVDQDVRRDLQSTYKAKITAAEKELKEITGRDINIKSPKQVGAYLYDKTAGLGLPLREGTGEDVLVALQANNCRNNPLASRVIDLILDIRRYYKTLNTYLQAEPDYDGRMRTSYRITGTETGRSSTSIMEPPIRPTKVGLSFQTMTKHGDVGAEVRSMFVADPGHVFVNVDLSQAEAREVALFARDEYLLNLFATGQDVHSITASWIFNKSPEFIHKETERFIGKTSRHSAAYMSGKRRYMLSVNNDIKKFKINMMPISEFKAGQILTTFFQKSPNIREVFHAEVIAQLHQDQTIINGYGRRRQFLSRLDDSMYREALAHICSSTIADHVKHSLLKAKEIDPTLRIVVESHDAVTLISPEDKKFEQARLIKELFEIPIPHDKCSLPRDPLKIPADVEMGYNYRDLKKVKV